MSGTGMVRSVCVFFGAVEFPQVLERVYMVQSVCVC